MNSFSSLLKFGLLKMVTASVVVDVEGGMKGEDEDVGNVDVEVAAVEVLGLLLLLLLLLFGPLKAASLGLMEAREMGLGRPVSAVCRNGGSGRLNIGLGRGSDSFSATEVPLSGFAATISASRLARESEVGNRFEEVEKGNWRFDRSDSPPSSSSSLAKRARVEVNRSFSDLG